MLRSAAVKVSLAEPESAVQEMVALMKSFGTTALHLFHVASGSDRKLKRRQGRLEELAEKTREAGFEVDAAVSRGPVPSRILAMARERGVDYLALHWMRKPVLMQAILGSIDADILRLSDLPVLVYNRSLMSASTRVKRVLYATDLQATDRCVLPYLTSHEIKAEELFLLNVGQRAPDPSTEHARRDRVQRHLDRLAEELADSYNVIQTLQVVGNYRSQILRQAQMNKVDLIVVGKADSPKPIKNLLGSTAEAISDKSNRSVLIVPGVH